MSNPIKTRLADLDDDLFIPRELSWLSFNARVLQEAADDSVPIIQRLRYLGIFSNNLDEFFRVRVAEVKRLISVATATNRQQSKDLLKQIQDKVVALQKEFDKTYLQVLKGLRQRRIYMINEKQMDAGQADFVQRYFTQTVLPELEPILLVESQPMPILADESIYLAVNIHSAEERLSAIVEVPTDRLDRFVEIPRKHGKSGKVFMALDNIIRACLAQMFRGVIQVDEAQAYCFKFSRDAE
ncbi:MAG: polyphosphate kinase, partial [Bacteroidia bacterium]